MKNLSLFFVIFSLCLTVTFAQGPDWQISKSTHFVIHYKNAPETFIKELTDKAEEYYNKIAEDLGFMRYNFWLWDNRAKIYIYDDEKDYRISTGEPGWSAGSSEMASKTIQTFPYATGFFETTLPHEMGHIIFREFVGFDNPAVPNWLDEGVASCQQRSKQGPGERLVIKEAISKNKFMNLEDLSRMDLRLSQDAESVSLYYAEASSIVDYLIKEFGRDSFVLFCQNLRDKKNLERALASSYPFSNLKNLDEAWQKYLNK